MCDCSPIRHPRDHWSALSYNSGSKPWYVTELIPFITMRCHMSLNPLLKSAWSKAALITVLAGIFPPALSQPPATLPEFTHLRSDEWVNSPALTLNKLRGKVVLVEFWAYQCVNCLNSAAWVEAIAEQQSSAGLVVIGVHTPELQQERSAENVRAAVKRLHVSYPVMLDPDYSYWRALRNKYWPAFYVVDRNGRIRSNAIGEMHIGAANANELEAVIKSLLAAPG